MIVCNLRSLLGLLVCGATLFMADLSASQLQPRQVVSPITGQPFEIVDIPVEALTANNATDMGTDDDGCRHSSGVNEYDHYIVTDPYCYFSAMAYEWKSNGAFRSGLEPEFKRWVTSKDGFHSDWVIDKDKFYHRANERARASGKPIVPIHDWVIPQEVIPVENKYRYALMSYRRRGAPDAFLGKLALTGAWAVRVRINRPLTHSRLRGGVEEVNDRLNALMEPGDSFDLDAVVDAYRSVLSRPLSDEGFFVAGITQVGLLVRQGQVEEVANLLTRLIERYDSESDDTEMIFRGLARDMMKIIRVDYMGFLETSSRHFIQALANEEFPRQKIPEIMLVVAENFRRLGQYNRSYDWYLALNDLPETDPRLRQEILDAGRVPNVDAPYRILLGWRAHEKLQQLTSRGITHDGTISGPDTRLLNAIVNEGLGTLEYVSPTWTPINTGTRPDAELILKEVGLAILDFTQRSGEWPNSLGELWERGVIPDRNGYNRFHCPISGKPLLYRPIGGQLESLPRQTVLIACPQAVSTPDGPRYGVFTAGLQTVWVEQALRPGDQVAGE